MRFMLYADVNIVGFSPSKIDYIYSYMWFVFISYYIFI